MSISNASFLRRFNHYFQINNSKQDVELLPNWTCCSKNQLSEIYAISPQPLSKYHFIMQLFQDALDTLLFFISSDSTLLQDKTFKNLLPFSCYRLKNKAKGFKRISINGLTKDAIPLPNLQTQKKINVMLRTIKGIKLIAICQYPFPSLEKSILYFNIKHRNEEKFLKHTLENLLRITPLTIDTTEHLEHVINMIFLAAKLQKEISQLSLRLLNHLIKESIKAIYLLEHFNDKSLFFLESFFAADYLNALLSHIENMIQLIKSSEPFEKIRIVFTEIRKLESLYCYVRKMNLFESFFYQIKERLIGTIFYSLPIYYSNLETSNQLLKIFNAFNNRFSALDCLKHHSTTIFKDFFKSPSTLKNFFEEEFFITSNANTKLHPTWKKILGDFCISSSDFLLQLFNLSVKNCPSTKTLFYQMLLGPDGNTYLKFLANRFFYCEPDIFLSLLQKFLSFEEEPLVSLLAFLSEQSAKISLSLRFIALQRLDYLLAELKKEASPKPLKEICDSFSKLFSFFWTKNSHPKLREITDGIFIAVLKKMDLYEVDFRQPLDLSLFPALSIHSFNWIVSYFPKIRLKNSYPRPIFSDICFKSDVEFATLCTNSTLLCKQSSYFQALLSGNWKEQFVKDLSLEVSYHDFHLFRFWLPFLYSREINLENQGLSFLIDSWIWSHFYQFNSIYFEVDREIFRRLSSLDNTTTPTVLCNCLSCKQKKINTFFIKSFPSYTRNGTK